MVAQRCRLREPRDNEIKSHKTDDCSEPGSSATEEAVDPKTPNHEIYERRLSRNEFRLACLYAAPRKDYPVHITLEIFAHDNRPEYETVSYQWGVDDGDYRARQPVYIGPFWDVILQTQNCWDLLNFARPWRGVRIIWIDAICKSK